MPVTGTRYQVGCESCTLIIITSKKSHGAGEKVQAAGCCADAWSCFKIIPPVPAPCSLDHGPGWGCPWGLAHEGPGVAGNGHVG